MCIYSRMHNKPENPHAFFLLQLRLDCLYLAHCDHLFAQVVFVFANCTVPSSNGFVFADHNVFGNFVEESVEMYVSLVSMVDGRGVIPEIMGDHHYTSTKSIDGIRQRINGRDIQTVGGLIQ